MKEFRDSPFNKEAFKYSRLISFWKNNVEYCVGDFVFVKNNRVRRIDRLYYQQIPVRNITPEKCMPPLVIVCSVFKCQDDDYPRNNLVPVLRADDILEMHGDIEEILLTDVVGPCTVASIDDPEAKTVANKYCVGKWNGHCLLPYVPVTHPKTHAPILDGKK